MKKLRRGAGLSSLRGLAEMRETPAVPRAVHQNGAVEERSDGLIVVVCINRWMRFALPWIAIVVSPNMR